MTQPTNADMIAVLNRLNGKLDELIAAINGLREDLNPPSPGPARGLNTAIRSLREHRHQTGPHMGFGAVHVSDEGEH